MYNSSSFRDQSVQAITEIEKPLMMEEGVYEGE